MGLSNSSGWVLANSGKSPSQDVENETGNDLYPDPSGLLSLAAPITVAAISGANAVQVNGGIFNTIGHATVNNYYRTMPRDEGAPQEQANAFSKGEPFQIWKDRPWCRAMGYWNAHQLSLSIWRLSPEKPPYGSISVAFIYCRYTDQIPVRDILAALVRQLLERNHSLLYLVEPLFERHSLERTQPTQHELLDVLANISDVVKTNFFVLDGVGRGVGRRPVRPS
ncbi:hypothetical protein BKA70DRAFT_1234896 [Coprinopsis sp. MPI-PUGE-AT-0042]|nr:hypothetical protein BKA70DRAFT_1234896 [Coprinopsis sp. MPI-PUGE-AT-0042]